MSLGENFPLNHTELGERIGSQELNLLVFPTLCPKRTMLNHVEHQSAASLIKTKSRILFYVHASMPPLRKPKQKMAARMNVWKMMMFHHEIFKLKTGGSFPVILAFYGFISFHFGGLDLHFLSDVKRTFIWENFSCVFHVDQRRSC